jgi:hypothetical protein
MVGSTINAESVDNFGKQMFLTVKGAFSDVLTTTVFPAATKSHIQQTYARNCYLDPTYRPAQLSVEIMHVRSIAYMHRLRRRTFKRKHEKRHVP